MSLKFGIYLVEQRIISPEQFCGLVKIQQEASMSLATIAIRKNFLTIKQVARVLDSTEADPSTNFLAIAVKEDLLNRTDAERMLIEQSQSCPPIRRLLVECGLLTTRQCTVLFHHYEKMAAQTAPAKPAATEQPETTTPKTSPRQPKFTQRPGTPAYSSVPQS